MRKCAVENQSNRALERVTLLNGIVWAREFARRVLTKRNTLFALSVKEQNEYLEQFREPKDDIERSFFQYKCQMKLSGLCYKVAVNLISMPLIIPLILKYNHNYRCSRDKGSTTSDASKASFFNNDLGLDFLPDELAQKYNSIAFADLTGEKMLDNHAIRLIGNIIVRYPLSYFFILKLLLKMASYNAEIRKCNAKAIIASAEYSFTSSVCTHYCNSIDVEHINIMHGEKVFYIMDAFFRFNTCYVFDEYYINLLRRLRTHEEQFRIGLPPVFSNIKNEITSYRKSNDCSKKYYKYYLAHETKEELEKISSSLKKLKNKHNLVCVRAHPIFEDSTLLRQIFGEEIEIESPKSTTLTQSLSNCEVAISLRSFVLQQAYFCGIETVVDDITNPEHYKSLSDMEYMMIKKCKALSEII